jgi:HAD superfamily hydrolase (TIGR01509 family)
VHRENFDACLFDMDGTLIDTEPYWILAETELVNSFGAEWSHEQGLAVVGSGLWLTAQALQEIGVDMDGRAIIDWLSDRVKQKMSEQMPWRPGALAMLSALLDEGIPLALVTMSFRKMAHYLAEAAAKELDRPVFSSIVTGEDVTEAKPDPEAYLTAAKELGVDPENCVAFEDSGHGAHAAFSAGVFTIGIPLYVPIPEDAVDVFWDTLEAKTPDDIRGELALGRARDRRG